MALAVFQNFTESARRAVDAARAAAGAARRTECGVDCLVLGLASAEGSGAAAVLEGMGLDEARLRGALGAPADAVARDVSFSAGALAAIEHAKEVASRLGHESVDTMHLLIGACASGDEGGLKAAGLDRASAEARIAEVFGFTMPRARMHPDLREWVVERVQAEAHQMHGELSEEVAERAIEMAGTPGPGEGADGPAMRLVRRAIARRHGGVVWEMERAMEGMAGAALWEALRRQAEALPGGMVEIGPGDLERALS